MRSRCDEFGICIYDEVRSTAKLRNRRLEDIYIVVDNEYIDALLAYL